MTELELYKWVNEWNPEWRWDIRDTGREKSKEDVILWVSVNALEYFVKLLPDSLLDEEGIEVRLQDKCIAIWASDICDHCDIKMENVFPRE